MAISFKHARERGKILEAAVAFSKDHHFEKLRRDSLAAAAGVAAGSVNVYFGTMEKLRTQVIQHAIEHSVLEIIRQAVVAKHSLVEKIPEALIREAMLDAVG